MADSTTILASDVVADLEATLDLDSWPDPQRRWWSGNLPERHSGKRFHVANCRSVDRARKATATLRPISEVATRLCECVDLSGDPDMSDGLGRARVLVGLPHLRKAARAVDDGEALPHGTGEILVRLVAEVRAAGGPRCGDAADAVAGVVGTLTAMSSSAAPQRREAHMRLCAAKILEPPPQPNFNGRRRPGDRGYIAVGPTDFPPPPKHLPVDRLNPVMDLRPAWHKFCAALNKGLDVDAAAATVTDDLDMALPARTDDLDGVEVTATPGTPVTIQDLIDAYWEMGEAQARAVIADWVERVKENLALSHTAGLITVTPNGTRHAPGFEDGMYPRRPGNGNWELTVPAVVAVEWGRTDSATIVESATCPREFLEAAAALSGQNLTWLQQLAAARGITAPTPA